MSIIRRSVVGLAAVLSFSVAATAPALAGARNIVLVHGALVDGSGWRGVYDILTRDGYNVSIVQQPLTSLDQDVAATKSVLDQQDGDVVLVGHSYGGTIITAAGADQGTCLRCGTAAEGGRKHGSIAPIDAVADQ